MTKGFLPKIVEICVTSFMNDPKKTSNYANKKYSHQKIIMSGCLMMFKANFVRVYNKFES